MKAINQTYSKLKWQQGLQKNSTNQNRTVTQKRKAFNI